jgi:hypothetical protein
MVLWCYLMSQKLTTNRFGLLLRDNCPLLWKRSKTEPDFRAQARCCQPSLNGVTAAMIMQLLLDMPQLARNGQENITPNSKRVHKALPQARSLEMAFQE